MCGIFSHIAGVMFTDPQLGHLAFSSKTSILVCTVHQTCQFVSGEPLLLFCFVNELSSFRCRILNCRYLHGCCGCISDMPLAMLDLTNFIYITDVSLQFIGCIFTYVLVS